MGNKKHINLDKYSRQQVGAEIESLDSDFVHKYSPGALLIINKRATSFSKNLTNDLNELDPTTKLALEDPSVQKTIIDAIEISKYQDSVSKKDLLRKLVVNRVRNYNLEFHEIIYTEAIQTIKKLTSDQIKFLCIIDTISVLIYPLIDGDDDFFINELSKLESYINNFKQPSILEIDYLKNIGLISSTLPYEINSEKIDKYSDKEFKNLVNKCKEIIGSEFYTSLKLNQLQLTPVGLAISHTNLTEITKTNINQRDFNIPLRLADFQARNIEAIGEVTAYSTGKI